jgi:hypothetical protein
MKKLAASLLLLLAWGCGSSPNAPEAPKLLIGPISIDSVELVHGVSGPSGLGVHVQGILGDGCTDLKEPILETRKDAVVTITIEKQRPADAICSQIAKLFNQVIPLAGSYPPGQYRVRVNDHELSFSLP